MKTGRAAQQAFAIVEYVVLFLVIIACLLAFRAYIARGYQGQMARAGESFAFGRQYDPRDSLSCVFDDKINRWYLQACYDHKYALSDCPTVKDPVECMQGLMKTCTSGCEAVQPLNSIE